jgi:hypothetical protein
MMIASSTVARLTSFCVIAPTPRWMTRRSTSSPTSILSRASSSASTEPDTSPLMMRLSSCRSRPSPDPAGSPRACAGHARWPASSALRSRACRVLAIWRAMRSSETTRKVSPASGTDVRPSTWTGRDGQCLIDRITVLVEHGPHAAVGLAGHDALAGTSACRAAPGPWPRAATLVQVRLDGHTLSVLLGVGPQVQGCVRGQHTASSNSWMLMPALAETSTNMVSPPNSSATSRTR